MANSLTEHFRRELHSHARSAQAANVQDPERIVECALKKYLGDAEVPRIVLDYFTAEYVTAAGR